MKFLFLAYGHERGLAADGGGFRKPWLLAEALGRLGHTVHMIAPAPPFQTNVPFTTLPIVPLPLLRPLLAYAAQFFLGLFHRADVIYFRSSLSPLPILLAWVTGARALMEICGDASFEARRDGKRIRAFFIEAIEGLNFRHADLVSVQTAGMETLALRHGADPSKIAMITSGTDPGHFRPLEKVTCRQKLEIPEGSLVVGFIGIFYAHQGIDTLIHAAPEILKEAPTTLFLLVGDGPARHEWEALAARLGVADSIRFTGQIPYDRLPPFLGAMDIAVAPLSGNRGESSPLKVLDSCAAGLPVVVSRIPCLESLFRQIPSLVPVPADDPGPLAKSLLDLLKNEDLRRRLGRENRDTVERDFSYERIAQRTAAHAERGGEATPVSTVRPGPRAS